MGAQRPAQGLHRRDRAGPSGKLRWAGAAWIDGTLARPQQSNGDDALSDAELWGIPADIVRRPQRGIWELCLPAVQAFTRVSSLFRTPGAFGGACGLDYGGVRDGLEMSGVTITPELWAQIQCVEAGAIEAVMRKLQ
ncbi:DUF1799 domain-containing protein [Sulfitobacter pseudonitzschiae]|uniref:DUF1799 domain-containing protein n=1 Tax=Pseudosulfitobacter pseudonitzschiae TaxID=1402135 RepID=A0A9Q2RUT9_9RHOB|nr:DUF1799 domain-containing protein [Pseudosulfitobacter pseudonitzschiae]MBM2299646.1 DUF1799 domain-containing protein [Pseudosulfitobacter pseudonitzschiae]MBM2304517.1 DUF1799 domain-containing protein [Pseudosulfitobacter pseudonitzschiae]MBM2314320.1 DUF1799 domain-containing protein [Pseudosulfitobacter pseudonitzschiae]MBM2319208.1 DUF1799 domain-containing protein [Pseudosulfitobacter pseudonitzschiae]